MTEEQQTRRDYMIKQFHRGIVNLEQLNDRLLLDGLGEPYNPEETMHGMMAEGVKGTMVGSNVSPQNIKRPETEDVKYDFSSLRPVGNQIVFKDSDVPLPAVEFQSQDRLKSKVSFEGVNWQELPWLLDDSGVKMLVGPSQRRHTIVMCVPGVKDAVKEIEEITGANVVNVMINLVPPGIEVPVHTDTLLPIGGVARPIIERWHLPILTNPTSAWWGEDGPVHMSQGIWFGPVKYWRDHHVYNQGTTDRVHLVVDTDKVIEGKYR